MIYLHSNVGFTFQAVSAVYTFVVFRYSLVYVTYTIDFQYWQFMSERNLYRYMVWLLTLSIQVVTFHMHSKHNIHNEHSALYSLSSNIDNNIDLLLTYYIDLFLIEFID